MEHLTVPGILESLEGIRAYITTAAAMAGLDRKAANRLIVAVDEVASNIALHGYAAAGRAGVVEVSVDLDERALMIALEDSGIPYDPGLPSQADLDLPLEERELGGWGLLLARRNVDEFRYERVGDRNRHTFVVYRDAV